MASYEEERARQIRENAEFLASLGIENPVPSTPKPKRQAPKKLSEEGEYKPEFEYSIRARTRKISYRDDDYYRGVSGHHTTSKNKKKQGGSGGGPRRAKGKDLGRRIIGNRIYDSKLGSSCHQCRQKTIEKKIKCSSDACTIMFDYKCLLIRYNEDADTIDHSGWTCPKCRGVCNCSFCMKKRGKRPTGQLSVFVKLNGEYAAKQAIMCDAISDAVLYPSTPRLRLYDDYDLALENDDYNGADTAVCSDQGADPREPKRYSRRLANSSARKKIAALADDSDNDSDTMASWDGDADDTPDRTWNGWRSCPSNINCIVLI